MLKLFFFLKKTCSIFYEAARKTFSPLLDTLISSDALQRSRCFLGLRGFKATSSAAASLWDHDASRAPAGWLAESDSVTAAWLQRWKLRAETLRQSSPRKPLKAFKSARRYTLKYLPSLQRLRGRRALKKRMKKKMRTGSPKKGSNRNGADGQPI